MILDPGKLLQRSWCCVITLPNVLNGHSRKMPRNLLAIRQQICQGCLWSSWLYCPVNYQFLNLVFESTMSSSLLEGCCDTKGRYLYHASRGPGYESTSKPICRFVPVPTWRATDILFSRKTCSTNFFPPVSLSKSNSALFTTNLCLSSFEYRFKGTFHEYSFFPWVLKPAGKICVI